MAEIYIWQWQKKALSARTTDEEVWVSRIQIPDELVGVLKTSGVIGEVPFAGDYYAAEGKYSLAAATDTTTFQRWKELQAILRAYHDRVNQEEDI